MCVSAHISHRATHLQQHHVLVKLQYPYIPLPSSYHPDLLMDELIINTGCLYVYECGEGWAVTGSAEVNTIKDWKWSHSSVGVSDAGRKAGGIGTRGRICHQSKHHTLDQKYDTQPAPPHAVPTLNTLLSISQLHTHTHM